MGVVASSFTLQDTGEFSATSKRKALGRDGLRESELFRGGAICASAGVAPTTGVPTLRGGVEMQKGARRMFGPFRFVRSGMVKATWECMQGVNTRTKKFPTNERPVLGEEFFTDAANGASSPASHPLGFFAPTPIALAITSNRSFR